MERSFRRSGIIAHILVFSFQFSFVASDFSGNFNEFLIENYGKQIADRLARRDIGPLGSYGGGNHKGGTRSGKQAVILVHGISNTAGTFDGWRRHFLSVGWKEAHVFGTTYGDGGKTPAPLFDMKCEYVKQVRYMIQSVAAYTRRQVDVIGYSMGSPYKK